MSVLSAHQSSALPKKNRFLRRLVVMQKGDTFTCKQNEFLFKPTATNTRFRAICSKTECVLPLNAMRFGAKCNAFWYKMECVLVLNAR